MKKKKLIWGLVILLVIIQAIIFSFVSIKQLPEQKKRTPSKLFGYGLSKSERVFFFNEYNYERLKNPNTGVIPANIQSKVLEYVSKLPSSDNINSLFSPKKHFKLEYEPGNLNWQSIGPTNIGGRMNCVAFDIENPNVIVAGAASGGIWKSLDGGSTWSKKFPANDNHTIYCLAQDTRKGKTNIWYAGSGELLSTIDRKVNTMARMSYFGSGIYKSTDNGNSWFLLPFTKTVNNGKFNSQFQGIWKIIVDPNEVQFDVVYAACVGGIFKSSDGGTTWEKILGDNQNLSFATDLELASDGRLYAALSRISLNGIKPSQVGIFMSTDKGKNWTNITPQKFPDTTRVIKLASSYSNPEILYAFVDKSISGFDQYSFPNSQLYLWKLVATSSSIEWTDLTTSLFPQAKEIMTPATLGGYAMCIAIKPDDPNFVLLGGTSLYRSLNGFANNIEVSMIGGYYWDEATQNFNYQLSSSYLHPDIHSIAFHPKDPKYILVASDGGIHKSEDITALVPSWIDANDGLITSQFYSIAIGQYGNYSNIVVGGLQDNGSFFNPNLSENLRWKELTGADGMHTIIMHVGSFILTSWYNGALVYTELNPLTQIPEKSYFIKPNKASSSKFAFYNVFAVDPNNPNYLFLPALNSIYYHPNIFLCRTNYTDFQNKWVISPPEPFVFAPNEVVTALSMPPEKYTTLFVGTRFGKLYRIKNSNAGANAIREEITGSNFPKNGWISSIDYDNQNNVLLVTFSNYEVVSIFASFDDGKTWEAVSGNLEENPDGSGAGPSVRWIKTIKIANKSHYFVATDAGLFSTNKLDGQNTIWVQEGKNTIGNVICEMIDAVDNKKIVVATQGSGVWYCDLSKQTVSNNSNELGIKVYPTVTTNKLNFEILEPYDNISENVNVSIYDYSGKLRIMENFEITKTKIYEINTEMLEKGSYIVVFRTKNYQKTNKFIKI